MGRAAELPSATVTFLVCVADRAKARSRAVAQRDVDAVLAEYGGIEVPVPASAGRAAVFANARGAAAAAVELRRGAGFRLGIHSGDAAPGRGGYRGAAAEHAPRVAAAAQPGQVLVTAAAAVLLEGALPPAERLRPLGEVALPDAGDAEPLFELLPGGGAGGLRRLPERPLLDREAELATLVRLVESARRGDGGLVLVEGSAGIGKTRLLTETRTFAADGMRVLVARGGEFEGDFVFGVVRQLFEPLLATVPATVRAELLSGAAELAAPLFEASSLVERPDAESDGSFAMLHGLYWLAANFAYMQPTLLSIDDLHWADSASLRWLCYLARRLEGLPLLVAGSTRPPEQARDPELLTDGSAVTVRPGPLGVASIASLARERFEQEPDPAFCDAVEEATRGNPLFTMALIDTVAREGVEPRAEEAHRLLELGPRVVGRAVALRLARLPESTSTLLDAAAILGDGTELRHVATLAGLDIAAAARAARLLVRTDLLSRDDPVEFFHPVVRSAIHEQLDAIARSDGHRRAAQLLLEAGVPHEQAGGHLVLATPGGDPFVVETLRIAATRSLAHGGTDAAVRYLARALEERTEPATRGELLVELGFAEFRLDPLASGAHLAAGMALVADPVKRGEAAVELGRALWITNRHREAIDVFERALAELGDDADPDTRERLDAELIVAGWYEADTYALVAQRIEQIDPDALHGGFGSELQLANAALHEARLARDRERGVALARRALASGDLAASGSAGFQFATFTLMAAGLFDEALAAYRGARDVAHRRGDLTRLSAVLAFEGRCHTLRGELTAALSDLREAVELSRANNVQAVMPYAIGFLALALVERAELDEAAAVIAAAGLPEHLPVSAHLNFFQLARGRLRLVAGEPEHGVEDLLSLGETTKAIPFDNPAAFAWRRFAIEGLLLLGRGAEARALAAEELEIARRWGAPHEIGASLRVSGLAAGGGDGERLLAAAVEELAGSGARLQLGRALVDLGSAYRRAGRRTQARELLNEGLELALESGVLSLVERANEELAATGARPRKVMESGLDALTPSERRVAELAADDLSNKEIAQTLFVTVKTVEVHLSSVYRKLALGSRRELGPALAGPRETVSA